ncbi:MAG TPA: hypothetical protein VKH81_12960 [Candidatus Angelobacter sp.]|nr:hypothetical protein [Candidatus Angelobacter sp.]
MRFTAGRSTVLLTAMIFAMLQGMMAFGQDRDDNNNSGDERRGPSITLRLPNSTQGPFWPPSEVTNKDGDFIVVGQVLSFVSPGVSVPVPNQAVIVSKDTIPALDKNGVEDPTNWFGAAYTVVRKLDLTPGSKDLDTILYTNSFGPVDGPHGAAPRIPKAGDSKFNLNGDLTVCSDLFPASSQRTTFTLPRFQLQDFPVNGFQGDNVAYNPDTGDTFDPMTATGCGKPNCPGEDAVDHRRTKPVTLGEWLKANGTVKITPTRFDKTLNAFTAARFEFEIHDMLPNGLYTIWAVRLRTLPALGQRAINPLAIPNVITTDERGNGRGSFEIPNPFPDPATDTRGLRIIGISMVFHSSEQTWGACFNKAGPGVGVHVVFSTLADGTTDITKFITKEPRDFQLP